MMVHLVAMDRGFSNDPFVRDAERAIAAIQAGAGVDAVESPTLDCKEEAGRRRQGIYGPGSPRNQEAAKALAEEASCLANTQGGVLIVGIDDKKTGAAALVGAELDEEWLRERIWDLTEPHLAVEVMARRVDEVRLLLVLVRRGFRLHRSARKFKHRIGSRCVEMSAEDQRRAEEDRAGYDWSAEPSGHVLEDVSSVAVDLVRRYLRETDEGSRAELAARPQPDLLRKLGVLDSDDRLNNAGALLFVDDSDVVVDYKRRKVPGGSSADRRELAGSLIEAYNDVKTRIDAVNEIHELQLPSGVRPRIRLVPDRAVREALINALMHRDYRQVGPVDVEFVDTQIVITSPGGFPSGIDEGNLLSERSHPRNAALANVFRSLRLAEQEGVGIDRMFRDMANVGHALPSIADRGGRVRCVLTGGAPSEPIVALIASLPPNAQEDVDLALILHVLLGRANVAAGELTGVLQKLEDEATAALLRGERAGVLQLVSWSTRRRPRWRLNDGAREQLRPVLPYLTNTAEEAEEYVLRHLLANETIKPKDVVDLLGMVSEQSGSRVLRELRERGVVEIGSENKLGRGVFHVAGPRFDEALARHDLDG
jgi:ATP-dependent DNA helicase RecG